MTKKGLVSWFIVAVMAVFTFIDPSTATPHLATIHQGHSNALFLMSLLTTLSMLGVPCVLGALVAPQWLERVARFGMGRMFGIWFSIYFAWFFISRFSYNWDAIDLQTQELFLWFSQALVLQPITGGLIGLLIALWKNGKLSDWGQPFLALLTYSSFFHFLTIFTTTPFIGLMIGLPGEF